MQVARNLMKAALEDPLNQRFMTISESCIPLYSPSIVYHQLMYAEKSRINACTSRENWGRDEYRSAKNVQLQSNNMRTLVHESTGQIMLLICGEHPKSLTRDSIGLEFDV